MYQHLNHFHQLLNPLEIKYLITLVSILLIVNLITNMDHSLQMFFFLLNLVKNNYLLKF